MRVHPLVRWCSLIWLHVKKPFLERRARRTVVETVAGVPFVVMPKVLNPVIFRGGRFLAESLRELPLPTAPEEGARGVGVSAGGSAEQPPEPPSALDLGTGSGVGAVFAARRGYRVTAVDLNPEAVRNARINVLLNGLEESIEILHGDLFQAVKGRRFDLILFNPPFFQGSPRDADFDLAWRSQDLPQRLAVQAADHLRPGGCLLLLLSTDGDQRLWLDPLQEAGFLAHPASRRHLGSEIMTIFCLQPSSEQR
ncbi:MAG TPA: methyltransferase [Acidobacteriota bacterium]|nr:methyltransferase [Acidobacteriota bacterium]